MPPKKATAKGNVKTEGILASGIAEEGCTLPLWDDGDIGSEHWGGDLAAQQVEASMQFVDAEFTSGLEHCFGAVVSGWKRPTGIFSPFKPMVFRPQSQVLRLGNPYAYGLAANNSMQSSSINGGMADDMLEEGDERIETTADAIALYRRMRCIVVPNPEGGNAGTSSAMPTTPATADSAVESPTRRRVRRRQYKGDPSLMRAFNSALLVLAQNQTAVPQGKYAWELIHPQAPTTGFPVYNAWGKYAVKLFFRGAYRKIVVDDRLPVDSNSDSILSVTDQKEIWPALILKAMLKAVGPLHERRLLEDPIFILGCLLGGSVAERIPMQMKETRLADAFRKHALLQPPTGPRRVMVVTVKADRAPWLGLEPNQLYNVMESRIYQTTMTDKSQLVAVRLCGLSAQWRGRFAYNSPSWTAEIEDTMRFDPNLHRNRHELAKQWNDFWVPWEDFVEEFQFAYFMHPVAQDPQTYGNFKQLTVPEPGAANAAAPTKPIRETPRLSAAAQAAAAAAANAANSIASSDPNAPTVKWLSFKPRTDCITDMVMVLLGMGRPVVGVPNPQNAGGAAGNAAMGMMSMSAGARGSATAVGSSPVAFVSGTGPANQPTFDQTPFSITVDRYRWRDSCPFSNIITYNGPWDPYATIPFVIPQAGADGGSNTSGAENNNSSTSLGLTAGGLSNGGGGSGSSGDNILYRVTVRGLPSDCAVSFMGGAEFTLGEEKDILRDVSIYTATDAGKFGAHEPGIATIWFKRWFQVKTTTTANFVLKTLPRHVDITPFKMVLTDSTQPKVKGGAGSKGAGGSAGMGGSKGLGKAGAAAAAAAAAAESSTPHPPSAPSSPTPVEEEEGLPALHYARLCLLDLDTNEVVAEDFLAKILGAVLEPNQKGYVLTASAAPSVSRAAGQWRLRITSNAPIEGVEQRSTDELHHRTGSYHHNTSRTIFSYNITAAELTTASLQLCLHGAPPTVAFVVRIKQGDKEIEQMDTSRCFIPHLTLAPPDKTSQHVTKLTAVLETDFAEEQEQARLKAVEERFRADVAAQEERVNKYRDELIEAYVDNGELPPEASMGGGGGANGGNGGNDAPTPTKGVTFNLPPPSSPAAGGAAGDRAVSPPLSSFNPSMIAAPSRLTEEAATLETALNEASDTFGLSFSVYIHASSTRLDLQEDTTTADSVTAAKAAWAKRDQPEGAQPTGGKATKANPKNQAAAQDEAAARATKAKEARLRFLANPTSVFVPFVGLNGVTYTDASESGGGGLLLQGPPSTAESGDGDGSPTAAPTPLANTAVNPALFRVAPSEAIDVDELRSQQAADEEALEARMAALPPTALPGTANHKTALLAILARVEEGLTAQSAKRKEFFLGASNVLMGAYDIKPQTTEVEDDKKKKKR